MRKFFQCGCMRRLALLALAGLALVFTPGCNKAEDAQVETADTNPDLAELNREVKRWIMKHRDMPTNFAQFEATAGVPIKPPPPGKKYVLDEKMHVQLKNR